MSGFQFDQIGYWSEVKLDIVRQYAQAYSQILAAQRLPNGGARLKDVAGFEWVPSPMPMRNSSGAVVYYLFFASQKSVAQKIVLDLFSKHAERRS